MNLFIYEHISSGYFIDQAIPDDLVDEGLKMLNAVLNDCTDIPELKVYVMCDNRLVKAVNYQSHTQLAISIIENLEQFETVWSSQLTKADAILIIAPETEGVMANLQLQASQHNSHVLGCSPSAIALTSNKYTCYKNLKHLNINQPYTSIASEWNTDFFDSDQGFIIKPIDGAGCVNTFLFETEDELKHYLSGLSNNELDRRIIQSYLNGIHISLSALITDLGIEILSINRQLIERNNNVVDFKGVIVNDSHLLEIYSHTEATLLLNTVVEAIDGLSGFIGIDLVLFANKAYVIDINPRITTAYVGLSKSIGINPLSRLLKIDTSPLTSAPYSKEVEVHL